MCSPGEYYNVKYFSTERVSSFILNVKNEHILTFFILDILETNYNRNKTIQLFYHKISNTVLFLMFDFVKNIKF